jgi:putative membrane protein
MGSAGAVAIAITLVLSLYAIGVSRLWAVTGGHRVVQPWQVLAFAGGVVVLLLALVSPLHDSAERDLTWHMVQHVLLLTVAAPLLAASAPITASLYALPTRARRTVQPAWRRVLRSQTGRGWAAWTAFALALASATLALWHVPVLYDAAVRDDGVHVLEHMSFVVTAMLFWWMALGAGRPSRRGLGVLGVFVATLPATALGVLMTLATTSWYTPYGRGAGAVERQQVAGAVMWGFGGLALVVAAAALFAAWLVGMDRADERARAHAAAEPW